MPLGKELGQQVVVENLGGVAGALAAQKVLAADFAALAETMAQASGMKLESENKKVPTGLER